MTVCKAVCTTDRYQSVKHNIHDIPIIRVFNRIEPLLAEVWRGRLTNPEFLSHPEVWIHLIWIFENLEVDETGPHPRFKNVYGIGREVTPIRDVQTIGVPRLSHPANSRRGISITLSSIIAKLKLVLLPNARDLFDKVKFDPVI